MRSTADVGDAASADKVVTVRGRVEIYDTDASGLIFYAAPTRWFCAAETDFVTRFDLGDEVGQSMSSNAPFAVTRSVTIELARPMKYLDQYEHDVWINYVGHSSYSMSHAVRIDGTVHVSGIVRRVLVRRHDSGDLVPSRAGQAFRRLCVRPPAGNGSAATRSDR